MGSNTDYKLIQSNSITYDQSIQTSGVYSCQRVNLSTTDQFTTPAGSVVGLYPNVYAQLLHTNTNSSVTTYQFTGNRSSVNNVGNNDDVNYNIAIRVHLGKIPTVESLKYYITVDDVHDCEYVMYICSYIANSVHICVYECTYTIVGEYFDYLPVRGWIKEATREILLSTG